LLLGPPSRFGKDSLDEKLSISWPIFRFTISIDEDVQVVKTTGLNSSRNFRNHLSPCERVQIPLDYLFGQPTRQVPCSFALIRYAQTEFCRCTFQ
jgi:hypothetical protein